MSHSDNTSSHSRPEPATPTHDDIARVRAFLVELQANICQALEAQERKGGGTATFVPDDLGAS